MVTCTMITLSNDVAYNGCYNKQFEGDKQHKGWFTHEDLGWGRRVGAND